MDMNECPYFVRNSSQQQLPCNLSLGLAQLIGPERQYIGLWGEKSGEVLLNR